MEEIQIKHALVLKEAKLAFNKVDDDPMESLYMIDAIQRLGIEHLFQEEIEKALILNQTSKLGINISSDSMHNLKLCEVALQFRLHRQAGHYVHADIFDCFKNKQGMIKEKYSEDIKGLVALYEASQLSIEGEDSLVQAGNLSRQLLERRLSTHEGHCEAQAVANALQNPLHHSLSRFTNTSIVISSSDFLMRNRWTTSFAELAEINSCLIRHLNQNEIFQVSKWWKELEVAKAMAFARFNPDKWYLWPMACLTDPKFSKQRIELIKPVSLVYIIDDIFDVYGSLDQLTNFANAVNRWESTATEKLPDYMKICFNLLQDTINEMASKVQEKHGLNPINSLKKSWAALLNSFLVEARWLNSGHLPQAEEYLKNGIVSSGVHVVFLHAFFLLDEGITEETVAIMDQIPSVSSLVGEILRLCDDLEGAKSDDQSGVDGSYLDYYMKENGGVSEEEAQTHVAHLISKAWKRLNQETLITSPFPSSFTKFCLNAARMVLLMYSYRRNESLSDLQEYVRSLLHIDESIDKHINIPSSHEGQGHLSWNATRNSGKNRWRRWAWLRLLASSSGFSGLKDAMTFSRTSCKQLLKYIIHICLYLLVEDEFGPKRDYLRVCSFLEWWVIRDTAGDWVMGFVRKIGCQPSIATGIVNFSNQNRTGRHVNVLVRPCYVRILIP
ncbi:neryl diphosphate diphosphatase, chloroplastic-like [Prosopis cineraria]|uniref:neryl diphosphate diphosphatase, chloroplastic-like n=1 Tax=Prosopis cineraria TaxID=364024 RepID=UPI00240FA34D|nr:neryl diphosphate diphosphatase, chloroplastic-like [Prosopis cineraria]